MRFLGMFCESHESFTNEVFIIRWGHRIIAEMAHGKEASSVLGPGAMFRTLSFSNITNLLPQQFQAIDLYEQHKDIVEEPSKIIVSDLVTSRPSYRVSNQRQLPAPSRARSSLGFAPSKSVTEYLRRFEQPALKRHLSVDSLHVSKTNLLNPEKRGPRKVITETPRSRSPENNGRSISNGAKRTSILYIRCGDNKDDPGIPKGKSLWCFNTMYRFRKYSQTSNFREESITGEDSKSRTTAKH